PWCRLNGPVGRIASSFTLPLAGREAGARRQFQDHWPRYDKQLRVEQENITLPGEAELVADLTRLTGQYREQGERFFARPAGAEDRTRDYFGTGVEPGLLGLFDQIKTVSGNILRIHQENME